MQKQTSDDLNPGGDLQHKSLNAPLSSTELAELAAALEDQPNAAVNWFRSGRIMRRLVAHIAEAERRCVPDSFASSHVEQQESAAVTTAESPATFEELPFAYPLNSAEQSFLANEIRDAIENLPEDGDGDDEPEIRRPTPFHGLVRSLSRRNFVRACVGLAASVALAIVLMNKSAPPAVTAEIKPADHKHFHSGGALRPETKHIATISESHSPWVFLVCDSHGIVEMGAGDVVRTGTASTVSFTTPSSKTSQYIYTIVVATNRRCPDLLSCMRAKLTAQHLNNLQQDDYVENDPNCVNARKFFTEIADSCKCTDGRSTVTVLRRVIAEPSN